MRRTRPSATISRSCGHSLKAAASQQRGTGAGVVAGGLLYGLSVSSSVRRRTDGCNLSDTLANHVFSAGITVVFLIALTWITWTQSSASEGGVVARALEAAFARRRHRDACDAVRVRTIAFARRVITIWLLYPCAVFALQGAAWMVAWRLRRRAWLGVVAFGWMLSAVALSSTIGSPLYPLVAGIALVLFMAVPGAVMMRPAR